VIAPVITPTPSEDEAAAIIVALDAFTTSAVVADADTTPSSAWRFSGRWWVGSTVVRRTRPHG
jgi:hypothetical protein